MGGKTNRVADRISRSNLEKDIGENVVWKLSDETPPKLGNKLLHIQEIDQLMKLYTTFFYLVIITLLAITCSQAQEESNTNTNDTEEKPGRQITYEREVSFLSADGATLSTIEVAVADEENERNQGLMDVRDLPQDKGMLFIFEESEPRSFWMANTPLALDIIFVNEDYEIVRIHHSTKPFSEKNFESEKPAKYVIETNAGFTISHDIKEGMKVSF